MGTGILLTDYTGCEWSLQSPVSFTVSQSSPRGIPGSNVRCGIWPFTKLENHRGLQVWKAGRGGRAENRAHEQIFETCFPRVRSEANQNV